MIKIKKYIFQILLILIIFANCSESIQKKEQNLTKKDYQLKLICFDFDGTIANTLHIAMDCVNQLSDEYNYIPIKNISLFRNKNMHEIIRKNLGLWLYQVPMYVKKIKSIMFKQIHKANIFNEMPKLLSQLSKNYKIAIITSNSKKNVEVVLKKAEIQNIDFIHSDSSIFGKGLVIKNFIKKHNLSNKEIIYVGDEVRDIRACKKIGVKIISVSWGYNSGELLIKEKPDYLVNKPYEIYEILKKQKN
ncbi:HAD-IA family hydrolase [Candidatus Dependentiae bacterium]